MPIHVTVDLLQEDGMTVEDVAEALARLKPATIAVDLAGPVGRTLLASLTSRGLPAAVLEKRPRPTLHEVTRITELSREVEELKRESELQKLDLRRLREYQKDVSILIQRLEQ